MKAGPFLYAGNDLARALKWGGGYSGEKIMHLLRCIEEADSVPFDRSVCVCVHLFLCV